LIFNREAPGICPVCPMVNPVLFVSAAEIYLRSPGCAARYCFTLLWPSADQ